MNERIIDKIKPHINVRLLLTDEEILKVDLDSYYKPGSPIYLPKIKNSILTYTVKKFFQALSVPNVDFTGKVLTLGLFNDMEKLEDPVRCRVNVFDPIPLRIEIHFKEDSYLFIFENKKYYQKFLITKNEIDNLEHPDEFLVGKFNYLIGSEIVFLHKFWLLKS